VKFPEFPDSVRQGNEITYHSSEYNQFEMSRGALARIIHFVEKRETCINYLLSKENPNPCAAGSFSKQSSDLISSSLCTQPIRFRSSASAKTSGSMIIAPRGTALPAMGQFNSQKWFCQIQANTTN
jgi:hypothetical protein